MKDNPHSDAVWRDPDLASIMEESGAKIRSLSRIQVEKLIFYLKAIHDHFPNSENHVAFWTEFSAKLDALKVSEEQKRLQSQSSRKILLGMAACLCAGVLISPILASQLAWITYLGTATLLVAATAIVVVADNLCFKRAILLSKEQDRKYFLASIRAARACNELDWAGLFTYNSASKLGPQSNADLERTAEVVAKLTDSLRSALYNDEFLQYSDKELSATTASDSLHPPNEGS